MPKRKAEITIIPPDDSTVEGEIITQQDIDDEQFKAECVIVTDLALKLAPAEHIADELNMSLEDFQQRHGNTVRRALNSLTTELSNVMVSNALGFETKGSIKAAAWVLDRLNWNPGEAMQVHGALNQTSPIVTHGEQPPRRKAVVSEAMQKRIENKQNKGRRKK